MQHRKKCLILTASIGAGHRQVAETLAVAAKKNFLNLDIQVFDLLDFFPKSLTSRVLKVYQWVLMAQPWLYRFFYGAGNARQGARWFASSWNRILAALWRRKNLDSTVDLIICTHASAAGLVAELKSQGVLQAPVLGVITDFTVHRLWVYAQVEAYSVASKSMIQQLRQFGYSGPVYECGIPLRPEFYEFKKGPDLQPTHPRGAYSLLLMGGGLGLLPMEQIIQAILASLLPIQIVAVTGSNQALYQRLRAGFFECKQVTVKAYCHNIAQLMSQSDLLITKSGGLSTMEAVQLELPILIFDPLPGQEQANADFLTSQHLALQVGSIPDLLKIMTNLLGVQNLPLHPLPGFKSGNFNSGLDTVLEWIQVNLSD